MLITRWDDVPPRAWKNGGGSTRELVTWPPGSTTEDFDWRISVADIVAAAAFSRFPGVRRRTAALQGAVELLIDGRSVNLTAFATAGRTPTIANGVSYDGGADVRCEPPLSSPTRLLNVMTRWPAFDCLLTWDPPTEDPAPPPGLRAEYLIAAPQTPTQVDRPTGPDRIIRIQIVRSRRRASRAAARA